MNRPTETDRSPAPAGDAFDFVKNLLATSVPTPTRNDFYSGVRTAYPHTSFLGDFAEAETTLGWKVFRSVDPRFKLGAEVGRLDGTGGRFDRIVMYYGYDQESTSERVISLSETTRVVAGSDAHPSEQMGSFHVRFAQFSERGERGLEAVFDAIAGPGIRVSVIVRGCAVCIDDLRSFISSLRIY